MKTKFTHSYRENVKEMKRKDSFDASQDESGLMVPAHVRTGQVMGLVDVAAELGALTDLSRLADELGDDIDTLLPILDTAEMLGLVEVKKGIVSLTLLGSRFHKARRNKIHLIRERLSRLEPFKTAIDLAAHAHGLSSAEVASNLAKRGIIWHHEPELNEAAVQGLLVHWAIYAGLLRYNGRSGKFQRPRDQQ
jgi:NitT/TauT family transport system ATP-binding protein